MKPQANPQTHVQIQTDAEPRRVRAIAPDGAQASGAQLSDARASAAAIKGVAPVPQPVFADHPLHAAPSAPAPAAAHAPVAPIYPRAEQRRRSPRQTLVAKAVVRSESNATTVATGFLSNISMLGVGFHTRKPLSVGEQFQLRLELGPMKWATRLRVVSCQPHDSGTFDVGAEFIGDDLSERVGRELAA